MTKVMFVCLGNICRSPMAEFVFADMLEKKGIRDRFIVKSSATSYEEAGNDIHHGTRRILDKYNIPYSRRQAVRFTKQDYENFDYILIMESQNKTGLLNIIGSDTDNKIHRLLDYGRGGNIDDPWYTGNFEDTYHDIVDGCRAFLEYLGE